MNELICKSNCSCLSTDLYNWTEILKAYWKKRNVKVKLHSKTYDYSIDYYAI